jgi:hypothetical protein
MENHEWAPTDPNDIQSPESSQCGSVINALVESPPSKFKGNVILPRMRTLYLPINISMHLDHGDL